GGGAGGRRGQTPPQPPPPSGARDPRLRGHAAAEDDADGCGYGASAVMTRRSGSSGGSRGSSGDSTGGGGGRSVRSSEASRAGGAATGAPLPQHRRSTSHAAPQMKQEEAAPNEETSSRPFGTGGSEGGGNAG
ncbi:unnamed protein product, partial [Phaeothamnion confervicola]